MRPGRGCCALSQTHLVRRGADLGLGLHGVGDGEDQPGGSGVHDQRIWLASGLRQDVLIGGRLALVQLDKVLGLFTGQ